MTTGICHLYTYSAIVIDVAMLTVSNKGIPAKPLKNDELCLTNLIIG